MRSAVLFVLGLCAVFTVWFGAQSVIAATTISWNESTGTVTLTSDNGLELTCSSDDFRVGPLEGSGSDVVYIGEGQEIDCSYTHPTGISTSHLFVASENHPGGVNTNIGTLTTIPDDDTALDNDVDAYIKDVTVANGVGFGTGSNNEHLVFAVTTETGVHSSFTLSNVEGHRIDAVSSDTTFTVRTADNHALGEAPITMLIGFYNTGSSDFTDDGENMRSFEVFLEDNDVSPHFLEDVLDHVYKNHRRSDPLLLPEADVPEGNLLDYTVDQLPAGLTFDPDTRQIEGIPLEVGVTEITYTATMVYGGQSDSQSFTITVTPDAVFEDAIWWLRADEISVLNNNPVTEWESKTIDIGLTQEIFPGTILDVIITPSTGVGDDIFSSVDSVGTVDRVIIGSEDSDGSILPSESSSEFTLESVVFDTTGDEDRIRVGNKHTGTQDFVDGHRDRSVYIIEDLGTYRIPLAEEGEQNDHFGFSVSIDGDTMVVGSDQEDADGVVNAGSAYVFVKNNGTWSQQAKLVADDKVAGAHFGKSVSLDGDRLVIGAYLDDPDNVSSAGSAYIFERDGTTWTQQEKLTANDGERFDQFGFSVSLSGDRAVVGAHKHAVDGEDNAGAAYSFVWGLVDTSNPDLSLDHRDRFGRSVATDGTRIFVTAPDDDDGNTNAGAFYILEDTNGDGEYRGGEIVKISETSNTGSNLDLDDDDGFGGSIAVNGDRIVVGAYGDDEDANDAGAIYILEDTNGDGDYGESGEIIKVNGTSNTGTNFTGQASSYFGSSIALDDTRIIVGSERRNVAHAYDGAVYILEDTNDDGDYADSGEVIEISEDSNTGSNLDIASYDRFGSAVAIDGDRIIVGSFGADFNAGAIYIFEDTDDDGDYDEEGEVIEVSDSSNTGSNLGADSGRRFGCSLAVEGNRIFVGAQGADNSLGALYILEDGNDDGDYADHGEIIKVGETDNTGDDFDLARRGNFSSGVVADSNRIIVGADSAFGADTLEGDASRTGGFYIFTDADNDDDYDSDGEIVFISDIMETELAWSQDFKFTASNGSEDDHFGENVSLSESNQRVAISARYADPGSTSNAGSVYIFEQDDDDDDVIWGGETILSASDGAEGSNFGRSVSMNDDYVLIGAHEDEPDNVVSSGAAYVFIRDEQDWSQQAKLIAGDKAAYDRFGSSVSLDGDTAVVGARYEDPGGVTNAGSAYVFERDGTTWTQQAKLTADDGVAHDYFGRSVSLDDDTVVIGATHRNSGGVSNSGAVYEYARDGSDNWSQQVILLPSNISLEVSSQEIIGCGCGDGTAFSVEGHPVLEDIRENRHQFRLIIADSGQMYLGPSTQAVVVPTTGDHRPTYLASGINDIPAVQFDGTDDYLQFDIDSIKDSDRYTFLGLLQAETDTGSLFPLIGSGDAGAGNELFFGFENIFTAGETPKLAFSQNIGSSVGTFDTTVDAFSSDDDNEPSMALFEHDTVSESLRLQEIRGGSESVRDATATFSDLVDSFEDYIGRYDDSYAKMRLGDFFVYDNDLMEVQEEQVQTYLALKYNLTLSDISRYISSDGYVLYDGSEDESKYIHNIAGVGEDDESDINIGSAESLEDDTRVTIKNLSSLDHGDFLIWGSDGASVTDLDTDVVIQDVAARTERVWRSQETGDIGTAVVEFDSSDLDLPIGFEKGDIVLLKGFEEDFFESQIYQSDSVYDDVITYADVDFSGEEYFTFALERSSDVDLGGVFNNLRLWLDANDESTLHTNTSCTSSTPADGASVRCWRDKSPHGTHVTESTQNNCGTDASSDCGVPTFLDDDFVGDTNTLYFRRSENDMLGHTFASADRWSADALTVFIVMRQVADPSTWWSFFSNGNNDQNSQDSTDHFQIDVRSLDGEARFRLVGLNSEGTAPTWDPVTTAEQLYSFTVSDDDVLSLYSDGHFVTRETDINRSGREFHRYKVNQSRWKNHNDAEISEIIIYDADIGVCNLKEVSGYLGGKYSSPFGGGIPGDIDCRNVVIWYTVEFFSTITSGAVEALIDQGPIEYSVTQGTAGNRPSFVDDAINRSDAMRFDGTDDFFTSDQSNLTFGDNERHYFFAIEYESGDGGTLLHHGSSGNGTEVNVGIDAANLFVDLGGQVVGISNTLTDGVHFLRYSYYNNEDVEGWYISVNGESEKEAETISGSEVTVDTPTSSLTIGRDIDDGDYFKGTVAEMILLAAELPRHVIQTTNTYFALKYGVTIASGQDYLDSENTVIYETGGEYVSHLHDVAGIGEDDEQNLLLTSSASTSQDAIMGVEIESAGEMQDHEFLIWGNDNGLLQTTTANIPADIAFRVERIWRFRRLGNIGDVLITADFSNLNVEASAADEVLLIIDSDNDFTSGATVVSATSLTDSVAEFEGVTIDDGDYVSFAIALGELTVDVVDSSDASVSQPEFTMTALDFDTESLETSGVFGTSNLAIYVENKTDDAEWTLSLSADADSLWEGESYSFDFNDSSGVSDGLDADTVGGQMTIDPSAATITASSGCTSNTITLGTESSFSEGSVDSITIATASDTTGVDCSWKITGIEMEQAIPAGQYADEYAIDLVVTVTAS